MKFQPKTVSKRILVHKKHLLFLFFALFLTSASAQTTGDYRSNVTTGSWVNAATWQVYNGTTWVTTSSGPSNSTTNLITISTGNTVTGTSFAISLNNVVIASGGSLTISGIGSTVTLGGNVTDDGAISIGGSAHFDCNGYTVSGAGSFTNTSGTLRIKSASGITASSAAGDIQTTTRSFSTGAFYTYDGSTAQVTGDGLPSTVGTLTVNNTAGLTLTSPLAIGVSLNMTLGALSLNGNALTYSTSSALIYNGTSAQSTGSELISSIPGLTLNNSSGLTLSSSVTVTNTLTRNAGAFTVGAYALTMGPVSTLIYGGNCTTGAELNSSLYNLTLASGNITMGSSVTINNTLALNNSSVLIVGANTVTLQNGDTPITRTNGFIFVNTASSLVFGTAGNTGGSAFTMPASLIAGTISFNNLTIDRDNSLTLSQGFIINGTLTLTAGVLNSANLTFQNGNTPISVGSGSLTVNSGSSMVFGSAVGPGGNAFTIPDNTFTSAPTFTSFVVNRTNALTLGNQDLTLTGALTLSKGVFDIGANTLTFITGNTPVSRTNGTLTVGSTGSLAFGNAANTTGNAFSIPAGTFTAAPSLNNFTIYRDNNITLNQDLTVNGTFTRSSAGTLALNSHALAYGTGATLVYNGSSAITTSAELLASIPNITINNSAGVTLASDVTVNGTLTMQAGAITKTGHTLSYGASAGISYTGSSLSTTATELPASIANLSISNTSGMALAADIAVTNNVDLGGGTLTLGTHNLTLGSSATITGYSSSNYIITNNSATSGGSVLQYVGATPKLFPVGTTTYTPVTVDNSAGVADNFDVRVFDGVLTNGTTGGSANAINHCVNKTWLIHNATNGNPNATITLQWNAGDENASFDRTNSFISHYDGTTSKWDAKTTAAAGGSGPYTQTRSGITSFSPFGVGDGTQPLPVKLINFTAHKTEAGVQLKWTTASEINNSHFDVEKSADGSSFQYLGTKAGAGTSNMLRNYEYTDNAPLYNTAYYRLKQVDYNGAFEYSNIISADGQSQAANLEMSGMYPIPATDQVSLRFSNTTATSATIDIIDMSGKILSTIIQEIKGTDQVVNIPTAFLGHGIYILKVTAPGQSSNVYKLMK